MLILIFDLDQIFNDLPNLWEGGGVCARSQDFYKKPEVVISSPSGQGRIPIRGQFPPTALKTSICFCK